MIGTPIFDQVRVEMPILCRICGSADNGPASDICSACWILDRDRPEEYAKWHCQDCGERLFDPGVEAMQLVIEKPLERYEAGTPPQDRWYYEYIYLCREHYEARSEVSSGAARGV